jgi:hypothetical protein
MLRSAQRFSGRGVVAAAAMMLAASACATLPQQSQVLHDGFTPLEARLYAPLGGVVHFAVSKPAYVAVFEVAPGGGMRMLFPSSTYQSQRRIAGGYSFAPSRFGSNRDYLTHASGWSRSIWPTYLVLIASERPLRVERMVNAPWALRSELGFATYYSASGGVHTIERLAERIVPEAYTSDWAYDTYIVWPTLEVEAPRALPVVCADGSVRMVRGTRVPLDCLQPPTPSDTAQPPQGDSAAAAPRLRGRPPRAEPEREGTTITQGTGRDGWRGEDRDRRGRSADERAARRARPETSDGRVREGRRGVAERGSARPSGAEASGRRGSGDERTAGRGTRGGGNQAPASGASGGAARAEPQRSSGRESAPASRAQPERPRESRPASAEGSGDKATQ